MAKRKLDEDSVVSHASKSAEYLETPEIPAKNGHSGAEQSDSSEDEDEDELDAEEQKQKAPVQNGRPTKKQRKQLTAQEVQMAREAAELFKSNIFKLQIDELISEVKIKDSHVSKIEKVLHRLHSCISQVEPLENLTLEEAEKHFNPKKVVIPFADPKPTKVNYKFSYLPPQDVSLVGSFGLKTGIHQHKGQAIDISLTMPESLFSPKDYLNYRALYKRSFYLAYLAESLIPLTKKNHLPVKISYNYLNDDVLTPVLTLQSIKTDNEEDLLFEKTKFTINLIVALPFGVFDTKKLLPNKNCIRVQLDSEELPPTPYYNSSLVSQTTYDYYLKFLYANKKTAEAFKDACTLGRLWLQQRGFGSLISKGGFGHFEFAVLLAALLNGGGASGNKILLNGFSSYQLFKGAIKYLATMDLCSGYLSFSSELGESNSCKYNEDGFNTPTIFDRSVKLNVLWKMTKSSYLALRLQAVSTYNLLNDVVFDRFDAILLKKVGSKNLKYDLCYDITVPEDLHELFGALEKISFITFDNYVKHKLSLILKTALGDRVTSLEVFSEQILTSFPLTKRKANLHASKYSIGLELNSDECDKLLTKGPNDVDEVPAAKFRSFWGSKATLRRFKDGTIQHCVVWENKGNEPLLTQIVTFALATHVHPQITSHISTTALLFNSRLPTPQVASATSQGIASTATFTHLKTSFEDLCKIMYQLELPLSVKSILAASPALRNTSILQPVPFAVSNPDFWNDAILQFETSSRWPDEIKALEKTKTAFMIRIADTLKKETAYKTFITRDESIPFNDDITLLNVLTPGGYGFRFRILSERDEILYLRAVQNAGTQKALVQSIYLKFNQKYIGLVKHTRTINILLSSYPYFSPTVRLFKQWLDAQCLLRYFSDELVELIALKPFVDPAPYTVPNSVEKGFLQVLNFVANWNWKDDALILDLVKRAETTVDDLDNKLSDKLTIQAFQLIQLNFEKIRKSDPSGIKTQFFVGTKDDPLGILWSSHLTLPIAGRLTALSRAAAQLMGLEITSKSLDLLFTPALNDFDFYIKTKNPDTFSSLGVLKPGQYKNLSMHGTLFPDDITSKYDLVSLFVDELNKKFGNVIIFSTRKCHGLFDPAESIVCGVFVPTAQQKKKFRVSLAMDVKPADGEEVVLNKQDIFDQVKLLGGDIISEIKFRK